MSDKKKTSEKKSVVKTEKPNLFNKGSRFSILYDITTAKKEISRTELFESAKAAFKEAKLYKDDRLVKDRISKFIANPGLNNVFEVSKDSEKISLKLKA